MIAANNQFFFTDFKFNRMLATNINYLLGQTYLMFVAWAWQVKFFPFSTKYKIWSRDWINTYAHVTSSQMTHLWLSVEDISGCTMLFGSRIINCSQEETFGNLLSRLEEDKFSESDFFFNFFNGHLDLLCD